MAASGSDCGIANVNIGNFGCWKSVVRLGRKRKPVAAVNRVLDSWSMWRATNTINYSRALPLA
jgi:aldehyde dehydrogenase (NAD+)